MAQAGIGRKTSQRMPRDQRVARIMEVARDVLRERGSEQFLTSEVADRCGISEGTIYKYFPTRRDLLVQVAEKWFEEFLEQELPGEREMPIRERLLAVIRRNLSVIRRERPLTRFVLMELRADPNYLQMQMAEHNRKIAKGVTDIVEDGIANGTLRSGISLRVIRDMVFGAIEHQTWSYLRGEGDFSVDQSAIEITEVLMGGIAVPVVHEHSGDMAAAVTRLEAVTAALTAELQTLRANGNPITPRE